MVVFCPRLFEDGPFVAGIKAESRGIASIPPSALVPTARDDIVTLTMTPEDRQLLGSLRQQQAELQQMLARLNTQLDALESRAGLDVPEAPPVVLPPLPPILPPIPAAPAGEALLPPIPPFLPPPVLPPLPPTKPRASVETHFGRWLTRIGALFFVLFIVFFATLIDSHFHIHENMGSWGKLALMGFASMLLVALGQRFERKKIGALFFARCVMAAGLGGLFVTIYSAYFVESLRIFGPLFDGFLLLLWSLYVLYLAERRRSEPLALFAITLAYISTAVNPVTSFTMAADLILAATAVVFLLRKGWAALSAFSLVGTYLAMFRRLLFDESGNLVFDTSRTLAFWPHAIYLFGAWLIFTLAIILTTAPTFRGLKRFVFLSANNAGYAGLLALTAYIAGYGAGSIGWALLDTGLLFLLFSRIAGFTEIDSVDVMGAFAAQGLALFTAGIIVVYNGVTRAFLLLLETFLFGVSSAFVGDRILTISTYVAAFFATIFSIWEIAVYSHHPWLLGFGGALIMFINAWNCRSEVRDSPVERSTIVLSTSCYCVFGIGLIFTALCTALNDATLPPALALAALVLTFVIYQFSIFELPPLAQILLLAAQALILFPVENGEVLPWWSTFWVAVITLILVTWWSRQRITRTGSWKIPLKIVYAYALVAITVQSLRPYFDAQAWMVTTSFLSVVFLVYGTWFRVWSVAGMGQLLLALALYHFFFPPQSEVFPWDWWAAAVPVVVVFSTARFALEWLRLFPAIRDPWRELVTLVSYAYQLIALAGLARLIFGVVSETTRWPHFSWPARFFSPSMCANPARSAFAAASFSPRSACSTTSIISASKLAPWPPCSTPWRCFSSFASRPCCAARETP